MVETSVNLCDIQENHWSPSGSIGELRGRLSTKEWLTKTIPLAVKEYQSSGEPEHVFKLACLGNEEGLIRENFEHYVKTIGEEALVDISGNMSGVSSDKRKRLVGLDNDGSWWIFRHHEYLTNVQILQLLAKGWDSYHPYVMKETLSKRILRGIKKQIEDLHKRNAYLKAAAYMATHAANPSFGAVPPAKVPEPGDPEVDDESESGDSEYETLEDGGNLPSGMCLQAKSRKREIPEREIRW